MLSAAGSESCRTEPRLKALWDWGPSWGSTSPNATRRHWPANCSTVLIVPGGSNTTTVSLSHCLVTGAWNLSRGWRGGRGAAEEQWMALRQVAILWKREQPWVVTDGLFQHQADDVLHTQRVGVAGTNRIHWIPYCLTSRCLANILLQSPHTTIPGLTISFHRCCSSHEAGIAAILF